MSYAWTTTETNSFTVTHARHMAAKVAADLKRMQRLYNVLSDTQIDEYEEEVVTLLKEGYLDSVTYGFKRNGSWIEPTLRYTAKDLAIAPEDDDPGRVRPRCDVSNANFYSYLKYSNKWYALSEDARERVKSSLPFQRKGADEPTVDGYFSDDKTYAAGGRSLNRSTVRSW